jgi:K+-sensing histidine kinase KdpD
MTSPSPRHDSSATPPNRTSLVPAAGTFVGTLALAAAVLLAAPELAAALAEGTTAGRLAAVAWAVVGVTAVASSALVLRVRRERDEALAALTRWRDGEMRRRDAMDYVLHDMKAPLTTLYHVAEVIEPNQGPVEDHSSLLREAAESLHRMVFNLLDLSRAADGALATRRRPVDLASLLTVAQASAARMGRPRGLRVELAARLGGAVLEGDEDTLARVLENLLSNAIKYSRDGSQIALEADAVDGAVEVRVIDAAPVIPEASRAEIFEKYARIERHGDRLRAVSHGLGLAFCRAAATAHGGTLQVEPAARGGNAFVLRLPARRAA